jgi:hypothetical protein
VAPTVQRVCFGPVEGVRDAQANILRSEMAVKSCFPRPLRWLLSGPAKNELSPGFVDLIGEFLQRLKTSGIDGRHVPAPEDNDGVNVLRPVFTEVVGNCRPSV